MTNHTVSETKEKFFFDQNIFDEDGNIEADMLEEDEPPPVFSEDELEAAKAQAFKEGHAAATEAEKTSRAQKLADVLKVISDDMSQLFDQEKTREDTYEHEVAALVESVFKKAFPFYAEQSGFESLLASVRSVVENHSGQQAIAIYVAPDLIDGVEAFMKKLQAQNPALQFNVQPDEHLNGTACRMRWDNGGSIHDPDAMAEEILMILKDGLAGDDAKGHDGSDSQSIEAGDPQTISEPHNEHSGSDNPEIKEKPDE